MRKVIILAILIAVAFSVSACTNKQGGTTLPSSTAAFIGGTQGLTMQFVANAPPDEVTDNPTGKADDVTQAFPFEARVIVENVGEADIDVNDGSKTKNLEVKMSGFYPGDFNVKDNSKLATTNGAQIINGVKKDPDGNKIRGGVKDFSFPTESVFTFYKKLQGNQQFPFRAEACYKYSTTALAQICTLEKLTDKTNTFCNPTGSKPVSNSGAPVHVISMTQSVGGQNKAILNFKVKQVGQGQIFLGNTPTDRCSSAFQNKDRIKVTVTTEIQGTECLGLLNQGVNKASGELLLTNGEGEFTCVQSTPDIDSIKN
ncbi:hypothetical protein HYU12_03225 [Candidatus Woesearchaeota archaeon]|nr:hypothetical protein [Candidatus Woesearchaeota archaeon]